MMANLETSRAARRAMGAVVLATCATLLPASAMAHDGGHDDPVRDSAHGRTSIIGFDDDRTTVTLGRKVRDRVVVVPRARRAVVVQARRPGSTHFVTQSRGRSSAKGTFTATYSATSAGAWRFRLMVLPTPTKGPATSGTRIIRAVDVRAPQPVSQLGVSDISLHSTTLTWVNPADEDFTGVTVRRAAGVTAPASPVDGEGVTDTDRSRTSIPDTGLEADTTYSYAVFAHDRRGNFSRPTVVTVRTGRFGVTFLEAMSVTRTSVTLAWENPTDDAFTGVTVRRAEGPTPPATATDGTLVEDLAAPEDTVTDTGLTPGRTYSYAVFAHDGAEHVAAGVTTTVATPGHEISAMLSVNPLPSVHTGERVTADRAVAFDGSASLPAMGADLVSWEISYGDHTGEAYNGPVGAYDVVNTAHTFIDAGRHTVTLTVTDSQGNTDSTTLTVDVFETPEVSISAPSEAEPGSVPFEVKAETPSGTTVTSYRMEVAGDDSFFVDGDSAPATSQDIDFASGSYTVVIAVTNDAGGTAVSEPLDLDVW